MRCARISKQGIGQLATSLTQEGLVDIVPDPADKRAKIIRRTARGNDTVRMMRAAIDDAEKRCRAQVGDEQYDTFLDVLRAISGVGPLP
jgi:DNA-binding MarR family transcriptional regulator